MPKLKTKRSAAKRFKLTANNKIKRSHANAGHLLTKKSPSKKRHLKKSTTVNSADAQRIKKMLGQC